MCTTVAKRFNDSWPINCDFFTFALNNIVEVKSQRGTVLPFPQPMPREYCVVIGDADCITTFPKFNLTLSSQMFTTIRLFHAYSCLNCRRPVRCFVYTIFVRF